MAIRQLEINGYRSLKEAVWKPGALNLIVGPNGSGKSNLLGRSSITAGVLMGSPAGLVWLEPPA